MSPRLSLFAPPIMKGSIKGQVHLKSRINFYENTMKTARFSPTQADSRQPDPGLLMTIGELAKRSGMASSALRYYEEQGLIASTRSGGRQRPFRREVLRRIAFIRAAQTVGLSLEEITTSLAGLPKQRTPTKHDWEQLSSSWRPLIQQRIDHLAILRDQLTACIGCSCLSLTSCALYNPSDVAGQHGNGARYLSGDKTLDGIAKHSFDNVDLTQK